MTNRKARETVGDVIDGRYQVVRLMAEGGMGRVYEAEHVGIGKQVALKILHPVLSNASDVVARFQLEARIATQIGNRTSSMSPIAARPRTAGSTSSWSTSTESSSAE